MGLGKLIQKVVLVGTVTAVTFLSLTCSTANNLVLEEKNKKPGIELQTPPHENVGRGKGGVGSAPLPPPLKNLEKVIKDANSSHEREDNSIPSPSDKRFDNLLMEYARSKGMKINNYETLRGYMADAIRWVESRGDPNAISLSGNMGHYQWGEESVKYPGYGVKGGFNPFDPVESREAAIQYLIGMAEYHENWTLFKIIQAYNWGSGNIEDFIDGEITWMPEETKNYLKRVLILFEAVYLEKEGGYSREEMREFFAQKAEKIEGDSKYYGIISEMYEKHPSRTISS